MVVMTPVTHSERPSTGFITPFTASRGLPPSVAFSKIQTKVQRHEDHLHLPHGLDGKFPPRNSCEMGNQRANFFRFDFACVGM